MKFNEKLIELRKKQGLSQEELGNKLNVTRQTISKWELEQTIPEVEKLMEISKLFNVSVDDLINDSKIINNSNPIIEDQPIGNKNKSEKKIKLIVIGVIALVLVIMIIKFFSSFNIFNKVNGIFNKTENQIQEMEELQENIFDKVFDLMKKFLNNYDSDLENTNINQEQADKKMLIKKFNAFLEMYNGTNDSFSTKELIDDIITSNKTEERNITIQFGDMEIQDLKTLKDYLENGYNYEISFEYDENGFINKAIIEESDSGLVQDALDSVVNMNIDQLLKGVEY